MAIGASLVSLGAYLYVSNSTNKKDTDNKHPKKRGFVAGAPAPEVLELEDMTGPRNQGAEWVDDTMIRDEDGDYAHEFLGPFTFEPHSSSSHKVLNSCCLLFN